MADCGTSSGVRETNKEDYADSVMNSGIDFRKYLVIPENVTGKDPPKPIVSFAQMGFNKRLMKNLSLSGYAIPTPVQKNAIPIIQQGRDLMACAQICSGKSAAYLLPIIDSIIKKPRQKDPKHPQAVIVLPTRVLTLQIYQEALKLAANTGVLVQRIYDEADDSSNPCDILIVTAAALKNLAKRANMEFGSVCFVVLDEADRTSDYDFLEDFLNHPTLMNKEQYQILIFSGVLPDKVQRKARSFLKKHIFVSIGFVVETYLGMEQVVETVEEDDKPDVIVNAIRLKGKQSFLVYVAEEKHIVEIGKVLNENGLTWDKICNDDDTLKEKKLAIEQGSIQVLIVLSSVARGLNFRNVKHIMNHDMPLSIDEYLHRVAQVASVKGTVTTFIDDTTDLDKYPLGGLVRVLLGTRNSLPFFLRRWKESWNSPQNDGFGGTDLRFPAGDGMAMGDVCLQHYLEERYP